MCQPPPRSKEILIPAFNVAYIPMIKPIVESLKKHRTFGLLEVARPDVEKFGAGSFQEVAEKYYTLEENISVTRGAAELALLLLTCS